MSGKALASGLSGKALASGLSGKVLASGLSGKALASGLSGKALASGLSECGINYADRRLAPCRLSILAQALAEFLQLFLDHRFIHFDGFRFAFDKIHLRLGGGDGFVGAL